MVPKKKPRFSLKDHLFNRTKVMFLGDLFYQADHGFDTDGFVRDSTKPFKRLELKKRIVHIAETLETYLDPDFRIATKHITSALPPPLDPTKKDDDFGDFIFAPLGEYVARNGLSKRYLKRSLSTLRSLTQRFSMEDPIRRFINAYPDETFVELEKWSNHRNYHVRRLVSEGTRPSLPWSGRLSIDVKRPLPLLEQLHSDPTRYVTRSVANHMNDLAKLDPRIVLATLKQWRKLGKQNSSELEWMSRHSLRTLVKQGNSEALKFLGFRTNPKIEVEHFAVASDQIRPGGALEFSFQIVAGRDEALMIDYVIDFVKSNGKLAPKVHKLKKLQLRKGQTASLRKRHVLRADATTYSLYPGTHAVTLQINGKSFGRKTFELL